MRFLHNVVPIEVTVIAENVEGGAVGHHDDRNATISRHEGRSKTTWITITAGELISPETIVVNEGLIACGQAVI